MPADCSATTDMSCLAEMDVIDICVPTPLRKTKDPDLSYVVQAVDAAKAHLKRGQLDHPRIDHVSRDDRRGRAARARRDAD